MTSRTPDRIRGLRFFSLSQARAMLISSLFSTSYNHSIEMLNIVLSRFLIKSGNFSLRLLQVFIVLIMTVVHYDSWAVFTLGTRALVSGHRHKMVLCSDTGYPIYHCPVQCPSTRSRPWTRARHRARIPAWVLQKKVCSH